MPTDLIEIDKDYVPGNTILNFSISICMNLIIFLYRATVCPRLGWRR